MGTWDHVDAHEFADCVRGLSTGFGRCLHSADVTDVKARDIS